MAQHCATCGREIDPPAAGNVCRTCGRVICRRCTITVHSGPSRGTYCRDHAVTIAAPMEQSDTNKGQRR